MTTAAPRRPRILHSDFGVRLWSCTWGFVDDPVLGSEDGGGVAPATRDSGHTPKSEWGSEDGGVWPESREQYGIRACSRAAGRSGS